MRRVLTTVTLLGLLVATSAAFAITEHLKLLRSDVYGTQVSKVVAPTCHCPNSTATIRITLRHPDHVTVTIVDSAGHEVAALPGVSMAARVPHQFSWDGRTDSGALAPDGTYHPWVHLPRKVYPFANKITVDTKAPQVLSASVGKQVLFAAPGHTVAIRYSFSERAHAVVYLGRHRIIVGRRSRQRDKVKWAGTRGGKALRAGTYVLSIGAQDLAGNETPAAARKTVTVTVSYIQVAPERITVRSGRRLTVRVETAARRYTWRLGSRHGARHGKILRLRAPTTPGTYRLVVAEHGHTTTAEVQVRGR